MLQYGIKHSIIKMKRLRATWLDETAFEIIIAFEKFCIEQLAKFVGKVDDATKLQDELPKSKCSLLVISMTISSCMIAEFGMLFNRGGSRVLSSNDADMVPILNRL